MIYADEQRVILEFGKGTVLILAGTVKDEASGEKIKVLGFKDNSDNPRSIGLDQNIPPTKISEAEILCVFKNDESLNVLIHMLKQLRNTGPTWQVVNKNTPE